MEWEKIRGLFLKEGFKIRKWAVIGVYGGKITEGTGLYVLEIEDKSGKKIRVDTEGGVEGCELFGMINEDIHKGRKTSCYGSEE